MIYFVFTKYHYTSDINSTIIYFAFIKLIYIYLYLQVPKIFFYLFNDYICFELYIKSYRNLYNVILFNLRNENDNQSMINISIH